MATATSKRTVRLFLTGVLAAGIGAVGGIGSFTFIYARGASYLTNDPTACLNCHVMREQYEGWTHGSHHAVATCNDCHAPHDFIGKYYTKARNGFFHSLAFTTGRFPEPIQVTPFNHRITEQACRHCHANVVQAIDGNPAHQEPLSCIRCHESVGHLH